MRIEILSKQSAGNKYWRKTLTVSLKNIKVNLCKPLMIYNHGMIRTGIKSPKFTKSKYHMRFSKFRKQKWVNGKTIRYLAEF